MPAALVWTESRDHVLCALRAEGRSWDSIAAMLGISRWAAVERGRLVGARKPVLPPHQPADATDAAGREAMPAGHPASWGAITAGTLLDGIAYPFAPLGESRVDRVLEWAA